jgi:hypothetical protein
MQQGSQDLSAPRSSNKTASTEQNVGLFTYGLPMESYFPLSSLRTHRSWLPGVKKTCSNLSAKVPDHSRHQLPDHSNKPFHAFTMP